MTSRDLGLRPHRADVVEMSNYPAPGRGAWRLTGGLLPARPGLKSKVGYYRLAGLGEIPIGAGWANKATPTHDAEAVWFGVKALQKLVGVPEDGRYGAGTHQGVLAAQTKAGIEVDGIVGPNTMRALLTPSITDIASANTVPVAILGGLLVNESGLDPAAVGVNGEDHGLAQINLAAHGKEVSLADAMDPGYAMHWSAQELWMTYSTWKSKAADGVDPWDIAIANHNSPKLAMQWAKSGRPPFVEGRVFQIIEYVQKVRTSW